MSDEELIDLAHTILLRMAMRGGHDAYTGALLNKWLKAHESRPTRRAVDGVVLLAQDGELQAWSSDGMSVRWRPPHH